MAAKHQASLSTLVRLGRLPGGLQPVEARFRQIYNALSRHLSLHRPEAPLELGIGAPERRFRVDVQMAQQIDADEQEVAAFVFYIWAAAAEACGLDLGQLF